MLQGCNHHFAATWHARWWYGLRDRNGVLHLPSQFGVWEPPRALAQPGCGCFPVIGWDAVSGHQGISSGCLPHPSRSSACTTVATGGPPPHIKHPPPRCTSKALSRCHAEGTNSPLRKPCSPLASPKTPPAPTSSRQLLGIDDLGRILLSCQDLHTSPDDGESTPGNTRSRRER